MCKAKIPTNIEYPCSKYSRNVQNNHLAIECSSCNLWSHIKCNNISRKQYKFFQENTNENLFCLKCLENEIPFNKLNDNEFESFFKYEVLESESNINIRPNTSPAQQTIINKIKNLIETK